MKKIFLLFISTVFILAACGNDDDNKQDDKSDNASSTKSESNSAKQTVTDKQVQGDDYRTILPFKESQSRGLLQENMANSYNGDDFESGLLDLSKQVFSPKDYLYQDGQYLDKDTINSYLNPKYTKSEIDDMDDDEKKDKNAVENLGLNPSHKGETDPEKNC